MAAGGGGGAPSGATGPSDDVPGGGRSRVGCPALSWLESGILAGALAGALDASGAVVRGIGGLSSGHAVALVAVAASLIAVAGGILGALCAAGGWIAGRTREPSRVAAVLAALGVAPLVVYDAFALFTGHQAAAVPGHAAISVVLALAGLGAVFALSRGYGRRLAATRARRALGAVALLLAFGCQLANRSILPRLYGWFHLTLAAATLILLVLSVRLIVVRGRRWRAALLTVAAVVACWLSTGELRGSQVLRYAAHERTALASLALRARDMTLGQTLVDSALAAPRAHPDVLRRAIQLRPTRYPLRLNVEALVHVEKGLDISESVINDGYHRMIARCTPTARRTFVPSSIRPMLFL